MGQTIIRQPEITISLANADLEVTNTAQRVLVVGQQTSAAGSATGALVQNISSVGAPENALFGINSQIASMIRAFKSVNPTVQLDAIGIDDASGTANTWTITIVAAGNALEAGTLVVTAGSEKNHVYSIAVALADTPTIIAAAIAAAVNADTKAPMTAGASVGVVTLTAVNDGTIANDLPVECSGSISGVTGQAVVNNDIGATDPTLTAILDVATERYQGVVWAWGSTLTVLQTYLTARFNPTNAILDGVGFAGVVDTFSNVQTAANALNDQDIVLIGDKVESETNYKGPAQAEASYAKAALIAGIRSLRLSPGASISQFLTSGASLDQFGGPALASLPYFNTPIAQLPVVKSGRGWTETEIGSLSTAGATSLGMNPGGTSALAGEIVTTYKTDSASNPDLTWKFLNYVDTASGAREYMWNNIRSRFAQSRLTNGSVTRGRDMANSTVIRAYVEKLYQDLAGPDFVLVEGGEDALVFFKANLTIVIDLSLGKVTITMLVPIVTQLRTIVATMKIAFSTEG